LEVSGGLKRDEWNTSSPLSEKKMTREPGKLEKKQGE